MEPEFKLKQSDFADPVVPTFPTNPVVQVKTKDQQVKTKNQRVKTNNSKQYTDVQSHLKK